VLGPFSTIVWMAQQWTSLRQESHWPLGDTCFVGMQTTTVFRNCDEEELGVKGRSGSKGSQGSPKPSH
jgi:hypothetical protein